MMLKGRNRKVKQRLVRESKENSLIPVIGVFMGLKKIGRERLQ